ncbi:MAG: hypothetical protein IH888_01090 [Planctomycetes bacterium]|nr:hypothetical protein [Planctomycetota bacterium]
MAKSERAFWLVAGTWPPPMTIKDWLDKRSLELTEACRSRRFPYTGVWPEEVILYRADPPTSQ